MNSDSVATDRVGEPVPLTEATVQEFHLERLRRSSSGRPWVWIGVLAAVLVMLVAGIVLKLRHERGIERAVINQLIDAGVVCSQTDCGRRSVLSEDVRLELLGVVPDDWMELFDRVVAVNIRTANTQAVSVEHIRPLFRLEHLRSVSLFNGNIEAEAFEELARLSRLELLRIKSGRVMPADLAGLAGAKQLKQIEFLNSNARVWEDSGEHLTLRLHDLPRLEGVLVEGVPIQGLDLQNVPRLKQLWLKRVGYRGDDLADLDVPSLRDLRLPASNIDDDALLILEQLPLSILDVRKTPISDSACAAFVARNPDLRVIRRSD